MRRSTQAHSRDAKDDLDNKSVLVTKEGIGMWQEVGGATESVWDVGVLLMVVVIVVRILMEMVIETAEEQVTRRTVTRPATARYHHHRRLFNFTKTPLMNVYPLRTVSSAFTSRVLMPTHLRRTLSTSDSGLAGLGTIPIIMPTFLRPLYR